VCWECNQHYVIRSTSRRVNYYGCATNTNRGREICSNDQLVRRDRLEETLLRLVFDEVFSPSTVAHVAKRVQQALARRAGSPVAERKRIESELAKVQAEAENIKQAVKLGKATGTLLEMLEQAEQRATEVEGYLKDLRGSLNRDPERARDLLAKLLGPITLRREGGKLIAEMKGNLPALLRMDGEALYNGGSGGRI
jgi:predicted S18 family serine protease